MPHDDLPCCVRGHFWLPTQICGLRHVGGVTAAGAAAWMVSRLTAPPACEPSAGAIKTECLNPLFPLGEAHLRRTVLKYTKHYHEERNHQGLDNELIMPAKATKAVDRFDRRERLGGLLSFYYRKAA
jgi:hypothetical protein